MKLKIILLFAYIFIFTSQVYCVNDSSIIDTVENENVVIWLKRIGFECGPILNINTNIQNDTIELYILNDYATTDCKKSLSNVEQVNCGPVPYCTYDIITEIGPFRTGDYIVKVFERSSLGAPTFLISTSQFSVSSDNNADTAKILNYDVILIKEWPIEIDENSINQINIFPNPFSDHLNIKYNSSNASKITIYNFTGQKIKEIYHNESGKQELSWDGTNSAGTKVESGIYLLVLIDGDKRVTKKVVFQKNY